MTTPLILTLGLHPDDQARFDALRRRHFPSEHNHIAAHLTLFHHLPGDQADLVEHSVLAAASSQPAFPVDVTGLRSLGRGVAYTLGSTTLGSLRAGLARHWHEHLTAQDRQGWRPHITLQNKVSGPEAATLLAAMQAVFAPFAVRAEALLLWRYLGRPVGAGSPRTLPAPRPLPTRHACARRAPMSTLQALIIAVLQGATELFPISSLGHAVIVPALLGWNIDQRGDAFLPFLVLLHTGTAAALLLYFWRDWLGLGLGTLGQGGPVRVREARRMLLLIVVATIPAVILGAGLNKALRSLFGEPVAAAGFLLLNGVVLLAGERLRGRVAERGAKPLTHLTMADAVSIGVWQCGALLPGISRAGVTIVGGLLRGLDHQASAHFSFLIALPIIVGATVLEVPHLLHASVPPGVFQQAALAAILAGVVAWISTAVLMRYFRDHDRWALSPFAIYCVVAGAGSAAFLLYPHAAAP